MLRRTRTATVGALTLAAVLAGGTITGSTASAVPNTCGGALSDYVGLLALDTPFVGTAKVPGESRAMTMTPVFLSNVLRVELGTGDDARAKSSSFSLAVNASGQGVISFRTYAGQGDSTEVVCNPASLFPTRVVKIFGTVKVAGVDNRVDFAVSRA
ncbi:MULTISPECIES: hypothetical protein [unclassified Streptomyces]|uniref:hypothetical protein n=1 Tax=unclassified Streptomyces TaxID=2593676 RepID=UPI000DC7635E|nr:MULTISPECIES: hypothetical protein [unclassified Streptomyces]AWZ07987.1 hypothetical protein DRB89_29085 [Streptomyces sp. ICC4]AWZ15730.1 hypothetical protein DRB96_29655 [Streptomyces sp. ICC1]